jgi:hypothetical protein
MKMISGRLRADGAPMVSNLEGLFCPDSPSHVALYCQRRDNTSSLATCGSMASIVKLSTDPVYAVNCSLSAKAALPFPPTAELSEANLS